MTEQHDNGDVKGRRVVVVPRGWFITWVALVTIALVLTVAALVLRFVNGC